MNFYGYFRYDQYTGTLFKNVGFGKFVEVKLDKSGYRKIRFKNKCFMYTHVIWALMRGTLPKMIDHIDGNPFNNKLSNLREVTPRQNQMNMKIHREGHLPGTTFNKRQGKWIARAHINKKSVFLGRFATAEEAHLAYVKATT